ncbi:Zinc finger CCCH domain-containing protein 32 [Vitis vinifera]|uniref:Zinc finger CCCH domain-containing protein 32 n=1 Tax=Vitis vinifera TaxID=29760 RepID=A0A438F5U8_VITVI|nr:Zinc finger CCCH domain-containing protein 32 [Vitis vinifera]
MSPSRTVVTKGISDISCESKCRLPVELEIPPKLPDYLMEAFPLQFGGPCLYGVVRAGSGEGWVPIGSFGGMESGQGGVGARRVDVAVGVEQQGILPRAAWCRYNHPRDRSSLNLSALADYGVIRCGIYGGLDNNLSRKLENGKENAGMALFLSMVSTLRSGGGEYPERIGEPACQFYLKTGTCKFGASCRFHHPRNGGGSMSHVSLNIYGYPLRLGEKECSYYLKTGQCKFGITCKFHHPQPAGTSLPASAPTFYPTVQSPSVPTPTQYGGTSTSWRVPRPPVLPGSYVQGPYGPVLFPPGVVPIPGWSPYSTPVSPVLSPGAQPTVGAGSVYGVTQLPSTHTLAGPYASLPSSAGPSSSNQKEQVFPERPGQQECQYYLRTGDCKFGSSCRYHHPREWVVPKTNCVLSPLGLPLRPVCLFTHFVTLFYNLGSILIFS